MVKNEKLLQYQYLYLLSDIEILSAIFYCKRLLNKNDKESVMEFNDLTDFFFNGDYNAAIKTLQNISSAYENEYFKRHQN